MGIHNLCLGGEIRENIPELSSNSHDQDLRVCSAGPRSSVGRAPDL